MTRLQLLNSITHYQYHSLVARSLAVASSLSDSLDYSFNECDTTAYSMSGSHLAIVLIVTE